MARRRSRIKVIRVKEACYFCKNGKSPSYEDVNALRKFLTERNKILSRARSGVCSKHQRDLSKSIKHARHLALLPFTANEM